MYSSLLLLPIPLLSLLADIAAGQTSSSKSVFCNRVYHSVVVASQTLYVDGGELRTAEDGNVTVLIPSTVDTIDLSKPFSNGDPSIWGRISKNGTNHNAPTLNDGSIFADNSSLYLYGGGISVANPAIGAPTTLPPNAVWQYDKASGQWNRAIPNGKTPQRMNLGMSVQSSSSPKGFYLGGIHAPASDPEFWTVPNAKPYFDRGLLVFDEASSTFQNVSTVGLNEHGTAAAGFMNVIETVGTQGILVAFGGIAGAIGKPRTLSEKEPLDPPLHWELDKVSVYDVGSQKWYRQITTGDIPRWRYHGCSVVVSAPDESSHSIYVFGGWGDSYENSDGGVYVLSIPSFTWIRVNMESDIRSRHHCSLIGSNTMLVVGGIAPLNDFALPTWTTDGCDNKTMFKQGLGMFSLNNHSWSTSYDPVAGAKPYQIHPSISEVIGGNAGGEAGIKNPISGFDQESLWALLAPKTSSDNSTTNATIQADGKSKSGEKKLSNGAIAGISGGSVTAVVLSVALGVFFCIRRRQKLWGQSVASEMNVQLDFPELAAHKTLSELSSRKHAALAELSDEKAKDPKDRKIYQGQRAELGDVREWVFELSAKTDKSLPPTPGKEESEERWPTPGTEKSNGSWS